MLQKSTQAPPLRMIALRWRYGMLGTYLDLPRYEAMAAKYDAVLFVDDAHGFGVIGEEGKGIVSHYGASYENTIYVSSLEKALCNLGGFVVLPREVPRLHPLHLPHLHFLRANAGGLPGGRAGGMDVLETEGPTLRRRLNQSIHYVKAELQAMGYELVGEDAAVSRCCW